MTYVNLMYYSLLVKNVLEPLVTGFWKSFFVLTNKMTFLNINDNLPFQEETDLKKTQLLLVTLLS